MGPEAAVRAKRAAVARLEQHAGGRVVVGIAATAAVMILRRRFCVIYFRRGRWIHRYRSGTIVDLVMTTRPPEDWAADAADVALHLYDPAPGDVVFDVGAGVGHETWLLSPLVGPSGHIFAVEANPRVYECLVEMVRRNRLQNVTPVHVAAADRNGTTVIADSQDHLANSVVATSTGVEVPAARIDDLASAWGVEHATFVKMNIEGAERHALPGMRHLLAHTDNASISCHDFLAEGGGSDDLRTTELVRGYLSAAGLDVVERADERPWVRDCLYGIRR